MSFEFSVAGKQLRRGTSRVMVEANGVGAQEPAHAFDQVWLGRFFHEMKMVSHEAIGVHLPARFLAGFDAAALMLFDFLRNSDLLPCSATSYGDSDGLAAC